MIKLEKVTFKYNTALKPALENVSLSVNQGEFVLVTGPSGSGKSSICRVLNGLIPHFYGGYISGRIEVSGLDPLGVTTGVMATRVGMVFQDPENQLVTSDVEHEICFGMENQGLSRELMSKRLAGVLNKLDITHLRFRPVSQLSGGEKQKIAIASVLALHPRVLVLDEPSSELDPKGAEDLFTLLNRLNDELGLTIIVVEHRLERVIQYADRVVIMCDGCIAVDGLTREVMLDKNREMSRLGIGRTPLIDLYHAFEQNGHRVNGMPVTVEEGRVNFAHILPKATKPVSYYYDHTHSYIPAVDIKDVDFNYPNGVRALKNIDLSIKKGEMVAVIGGNGSGKTTLIKHLNKLLSPTSGTVLISGQDISNCSVAEMAGRVGLVFQNPDEQFFEDTVEREVYFGIKNKGLSKEIALNRIDLMLSSFDLLSFRNRSPRSLSGGEKQRLALASVLISEPSILVLDEPTRGIEEHLKDELMQFLEKYRQQGNTVILITHDVEMIAKFATRAVLMSNGRIVADGDKHLIMSQNYIFSPQINRLTKSFTEFGVPSNLLTVNEVLSALP